MKNHRLIYLLGFILFFVPSFVAAQFPAISPIPPEIGKVSRACRLDKVPPTIYIRPLTGNIIPIPRAAIPNIATGLRYESIIQFGTGGYDARDYWALESFTTYYQPKNTLPSQSKIKYRLRAVARTWARLQARSASESVVPGTCYTTGENINGVCHYPWQKYRQFDSGWQLKYAQSELPAILDFYLFRARAGTGSYPNFFEITPYTNDAFYRYFDPIKYKYAHIDFKIIGDHFYADSTDPMAVEHFIGFSIAVNDCNLDKWGYHFEAEQ